MHVAVVRIDRDSGMVAIERYLVGYDIGKAVNPMLVEGQIVGGVAQGTSAARCLRNLSTTRMASRSRSTSPII